MEEVELKEKIKSLGPWWEDISFGDIKTSSLFNNCGRSKKYLFDNIIFKNYKKNIFKNKRILDMGCNAGGMMAELFNLDIHYTGIDYKDLFVNQANFVKDFYKINGDIFKYDISNKSSVELKNELGSYDVIFCIGLIYHISKIKDVRSIIDYSLNNSEKTILSSQSFASEKRSKLDWSPSIESIFNISKECGANSFKILYLKDENSFKNSGSRLTNNFYFEIYK